MAQQLNCKLINETFIFKQYKDEYETREDFFWQSKGFTQRKDNYTPKTLQQI